jgi:type III pantothenate kinase
MLLAIDVGNTQTVLGLLEPDEDLEVVEHWRVSTDASRTADEWAVLLDGLLARRARDARTDLAAAADAASIDGVAVCSTVPSVLAEMREMLDAGFAQVPAVVVEPGVRTGIPVLVDNPREVGTDRIINAVAAGHLYGGPAIVVDFGTATTFDAVSEQGAYLGGAIAPGIGISLEALGQRGAQLRMVELARPRSVIGKNTVEAVQAGALYGFAGQVDGTVRRMAAELSDDPAEVTVIATGGLAPVMLGEAETIDHHEPWLTLIGLGLVWARNAAR